MTSEERILFPDPSRFETDGFGRYVDGIIVTLVHGTRFGPSYPSWTSWFSPLSQALLRHVPNLVDIRIFYWSGRNSHSARLRAARDLWLHDSRLRNDYPGARHYVIAHSHGGNVALYAYERYHKLGRIAGVACLSTPFFHVRARPQLPGMVVVCLGAALGMALLLLNVFIGAYLESREMPHWVTGIALGLVLYFFWPRFGSKRSDASDLQVGVNDIKDLNLLIIRSPGDEATLLLGLTQLLGWLSEKVYLLLAKITLAPIHFLLDCSMRRGVRGLVLLALAALTALGSIIIAAYLARWLDVDELRRPVFEVLADMAVSPFHEDPPRSFPFWITWTALAASVGLVGIASALGMIARVLSWTLNMLGTAFGFYSLQVFPPQITTEACPPGKWEVHHIERTTPTPDDSLAHSEAYSDPQALAIVIRWLGGTITD